MLKKLLVALTLAVGTSLIASNGHAMTNFARKYGADCNMCHTIIPKLTRIGYEFRLAGYRLPDEIGKEEKPFNLGDFFAARLQEQYKFTKTNGQDNASSQLEFFEFTMYPLAGSWGKYFASLGELSLQPDKHFEFENAFVRGVYGSQNGWGQGRIGVMHAWEGFGASDRPIGTIRPLFQTTNMKNTPFKLWSLDESGIEAGYHCAKSGTSIAVAVLNGVTEEGEPAQGGNLSKSGKPAKNDKDVRVFVNQFINDDSSVSLFYYHGAAPAGADLSGAGTLTRDNFDRFAIYANYFVIPQVNLLAGYEFGNDSLSNPTVNPNAGHNQGFFGEVDLQPFKDNLGLALRYDYLDPSTKVPRDTIQSGTLSVNWPLNNGLQFIADYQYKVTQQGAGLPEHKFDNTVQARMIFIY